VCVNRSKMVRFFLFGLVGILGPVVLFYASFQNIAFSRVFSELARVNPFWCIAALLSILTLPVFKTLQWTLLFSSIQPRIFSDLFPLISVWLMSENLIPFWGDKGFLFYLLTRKEKLPASAALSSITLDQLAEHFSLLFVFGIVIASSAMPEWMRGRVLGVACLGILVFTALFYVARGRQQLHPDPDGSQGNAKTSTTLKRHCADLFYGWAHHLHLLRDTRKAAIMLLFSVLIKTAEAFALVCLQRSLGIDLPYWAPFLVIAALNVTLMIPAIPGHLGLFEATVFFIYQSLSVPSAEALLLALLYHIVYSIPLIAVGYFYSVKLGIRIVTQPKGEMLRVGE
jgi:uncharacterized protein (TIRG00374 family)